MTDLDEREVRVAWWRIVALRFRALAGWGLDVPELRRWTRYYALQATYSLVMTVLFPAVFVTMYNLLPRFGIGGSHPKPISLILRASVPLIVICLLFTVISVSMSVLHRRRAKAGASQSLVTFDGHCFAVVSDPMSFRLFALIGVSPQHAQWFHLPIGWDTAIEPGDERFELTYNPVTGFVEQVVRIGAEARVLSRPPENQVAQRRGAVASEDDGEATPAQRREVMQLLRRAGAHWGASTRSMLALGLTLLFASVFYEVAPVVMMTTVQANPGQSRPSDIQTLGIFGVILAAVGIACLIYGVRIMRVWARFRRSDALASAMLLGDQICWTPKGSRHGTADNCLALVQADDGSRLVFRIPRKWRHRLWRRAGRVYVTYNAVSGHVLDYRPMEPYAP